MKLTQYLLPVAFLFAVVGACGGGGDGDDDTGVTPDGHGPGVDGDVTHDPDAPPGCNLPALDQSWVTSYVTGAIATLAAQPRYTDSERVTARTYLRDQLVALGLDAQLEDFPNGENVVATLPATQETDDPIIVGAHFDTVQFSPGADDNASGSALVLAVARFATQVTCRRSAVTFVMFDAEEEGLFGSRAYATAHDPMMVRAVHTFDQIGWNDDGDSVIELEQPTAALEAEWRAAAPLAGVTISVTDSGSTDHEAFRNRGYIADGLSEEYLGGDTTPHYHMTTDTPDTLDPGILTKAAKLAAQVVITEIKQ